MTSPQKGGESLIDQRRGKGLHLLKKKKRRRDSSASASKARKERGGVFFLSKRGEKKSGIKSLSDDEGEGPTSEG